MGKKSSETRMYQRVCRRCNEIHYTTSKASGSLCINCNCNYGYIKKSKE